jgi:hypothetical protein
MEVGTIISEELTKIAAERGDVSFLAGWGSTRTILNSFAKDRSLSGRDKVSEDGMLIQQTVPSDAPDATTLDLPASPRAENCVTLHVPLRSDEW